MTPADKGGASLAEAPLLVAVMARPSVTILSPPPVEDGEPGGGRLRATADYQAPLVATAALDIEVILPGHGDVMRDPRAMIEERLRRLEKMTPRVRLTLEPQPRPAIELAAAAHGPVADGAAFFVLCDTRGSLDELLDAGAVVETDEGGVALFAAA